MRIDKNKAIALRYMGKSYREISKELNIPLSTLSGWFKNESWSTAIKIKKSGDHRERSRERMHNLNVTRGTRAQNRYKKAEIEAREEFCKFKYHPLFITGITLYLTSGDKSSGHQIGLSSSNSSLIAIFKLFLLNICGIEVTAMRAVLRLYPEQFEEKCKNHWLIEGNLYDVKFHKTLVIKGKNSVIRSGLGVCSLLVSSSYLKRKMLIWLELIQKELISSEYYAGIV